MVTNKCVHDIVSYVTLMQGIYKGAAHAAHHLRVGHNQKQREGWDTIKNNARKIHDFKETELS